MSQQLEEVYAEYNRRFFRGRLPKAPVSWGRLPDRLVGQFTWEYDDGQTRINKPRIKLAMDIRSFGTFWRMILLHEMVHFDLRLRYPARPATDAASHDELWQKEMHRITKEGALEDLW